MPYFYTRKRMVTTLKTGDISNTTVDERVYIAYDNVKPISDTRLIGELDGTKVLLTSTGELLAQYDSILVPDCGELIHDGTYTINTLDADNVHGILIVQENGLCGVMDYDGNIVLPINHLDIHIVNKTDTEGLEIEYTTDISSTKGIRSAKAVYLSGALSEWMWRYIGEGEQK